MFISKCTTNTQISTIRSKIDEVYNKLIEGEEFSKLNIDALKIDLLILMENYLVWYQ